MGTNGNTNGVVHKDKSRTLRKAMFLSGLCRLQTQYMNEMLFVSPSLSELWDKRDQRGLKAWAEGDRPLTVTLGSRKNQQFQPLGMCSSGDPTASCFT